jgi:copper oxidase (laccase) domain-containing protein
MITSPFSLLRPFEKNLSVQLFTKEDGLITDQSVAKSLGSHDYAALHQMHGNRTIVTRQMIKRTEQADGLITDQSNLVLTIRMADCQPLIIYAPEANIVGLLHVGWKGLLCGAIPKFFETLIANHKSDFGSGLRRDESPIVNCLVGIGPCLCTQCADFSNPLSEVSGIPADLIEGKYADLRTWADRQLIDAGVLPSNIERMEDCTRCHPEKYWTYRGGDREAVKSGKTNVLACALKEVTGY